MLKSIIAVTGASGAGKSLFARNLLSRLNSHSSTLNAAILCEDSYYRDQSHVSLDERVKVNYDHPDSLEHELLASHLQSLRRGEVVNVPVYDYELHTRSDRIVEQSAVDLLIVEGILLFTDSYLRKEFDLKIFIHTPIETCLQRRLDRDIKERGRTAESVHEQFEATVKPMYHQYIEPSQEHADLFIEGTEEPDKAIDFAMSRLVDSEILAPEKP